MDYLNIVRDVLVYIEENLHNPPALQDLALRYSFSRFHFYRIFRAVTHQPLKAYIDRRRLVRAAEQLAMSDQNIIDIAMNLGFQSHEVFTRRFTQQFGVPPSQFRRSPQSVSHFNPTITLVEREFTNLHSDIVARCSTRLWPETTITGRAVEFDPDNEIELDGLSASVRQFVAEYAHPSNLPRLINLTRSRPDDDLIDYFYGADSGYFSSANELQSTVIPATAVAVFRYRGMDFKDIFTTVFDDICHWLIVTGTQLNQTGVDLFELYDEEYTKQGVINICVPIR